MNQHRTFTILFAALLSLFVLLHSLANQSTTLLAKDSVENQISAERSSSSQTDPTLFDKILAQKQKLATKNILQQPTIPLELGQRIAMRESTKNNNANLLSPAGVSQNSITLTVSDSYDESSGLIDYTFEITNGSAATIYDVYIYSAIPFGTQFISASDGYFYDADTYGEIVIWYGETFTAGESDTTTLTVAVNDFDEGFIISDDVALEYRNATDNDSPFIEVVADPITTVLDEGSLLPTPTSPNPTTTPSTQPTTEPTNPGDVTIPGTANEDGISVSISGPSIVAPNGEITYQLTVANDGLSSVEEVYIFDFLPVDTEFVGLSNNFESEYDPDYEAVAWFIGTLDVGAQATVNFTVRVPDLPGTTIYNIVYAAVYGPAAEESTESDFSSPLETRIGGDAAAGDADANLTVSVTHTDATGEDVFEITLKNQGSAAINNVFYVDLYIDPLSIIRQGGQEWVDVGSIHDPVQGIQWEIAGLGANETLQLTSSGSSAAAQSPAETYTNWSGQLPADTKIIYVAADSWTKNGSSNGLIRESNEQDNVDTIEFVPSDPLPSNDPALPTAVPTATPTRLPTVAPTPTAAPTAVPTPGATAVPDNQSIFETEIDFRASTHGYEFANWGDTYSDEADMNTETFIRMFGAANVCQSGSTVDDCVLSAGARQWRTQRLKSMSNGHCYGMAVTSQRFFSGSDLPGNYQAGVSNITNLQPEADIRAHITEFAISQSLDPADGSSDQWVWKGTGQTPASILDLIRQQLRNNPNDPHVLGFFQQGKGGHAVTPYAIEDKGNGIFWLHVYDNNWPGQPRYMIFDTGRNTWVYEFSSLNPSQPSNPWSGDARTDGLVLRPTSAHRTSGWACPFCQSSTNLQGASFVNDSVYFMLMGEGEMMVVNGEQQAIGFDFEREQFINNVPDSQVKEWIGGLGIEQSPVLILPRASGGDPYKIYVAGKTISQAANADLLVAGPGFVAGMEALQINPGEDMLITISPDGSELSFTASEQGALSPDFFMAVDPLTSSDSYIFGVSGFELDSATAATVSLNLNEGLLNFSDDDSGSDTYAVEVIRIAQDGTLSTYSNDDIQLGGTSNASMDFGAWDGSGEMNVSIDGENQMFDNEVTGNNNEETTIFLPTIMR